MNEVVVVTPDPEDTPKNPDPPHEDHGIEIGRLQAENDELRRRLEALEQQVESAQMTAETAIDAAVAANDKEIEEDYDSMRDEAFEEMIIALFEDEEEEEEAVIVEEPEPEPEKPAEVKPEKKAWWVI